MKYLPLIWAGLRRRPTRSVLTALSVIVAFVLFGLLQGVNAGFNRAIASAHRESLYVNTRVRGGGLMPVASMEEIKRIPGVREVAPRSYFTGRARGADPKSYLSALATIPEVFFDVIPNIITSPENLKAIRSTRNGMLVTPPILEQFGWKIGDTVPLESDAVKTDGTKIWTFKILGTMDTPRATTKSYFGLINYDYFNESRTADRNTAEMFYLRIADPTKAIATGAAIDHLFANSSHETRTRSAVERAETTAKQMGDVSFFTDAVMCAVIFALAFVTGNTLRQSLDERSREFAVLKSVGYRDVSVLVIALSEALLLCVPPAALGLALAYLLAPLAREDLGWIVVSPLVTSAGLACAALLAVLGSIFPALRLARMPISASLNKR